MKIGLLAGESSGDNLGAGLMSEMRSRAGEIRFVGVGGPRMIDRGLASLASIDELQVNGFKDPILKLPELVKLLRMLIKKLDQESLDAFVGVDFNVFNFLLEKALKRRGVPTAHYVSPSVYAWRRGRAKRVANSADLLLCLYPFEPAFYEGYAVEAVFVGHPTADQIGRDAGSAAARAEARRELGIDSEAVVLALLPGSRRSEVNLMLDDFLQAARLFARRHSKVAVVVPCVNDARFEQIRDATAGLDLDLRLHRGHARLPLVACDVALVKAGTSTLESMLLNRPMVVSYRLGGVSYQLAKRLVRTPFVALPNILAGAELVPELLQYDATPEALAEKLREELDKSRRDPDHLRRFSELSEELRKDADREAARAVLGLIRSG